MKVEGFFRSVKQRQETNYKREEACMKRWTLLNFKVLQNAFKPF